MTHDIYGRFDESLWGLRRWGKYEKPMPFNIIVNEMVDVVKHKDTQLPRKETFGLTSSLSGGCRLTSKV